MNEDRVLKVNDLGKCFKIYANPWQRAYEWASLGKRTYHQPFWALQNLSFEVKRGEFLGIIGQNGAGKSTLLKILSGILQPTTGSYQLHGRVLSMLELGMDFNPYLSGRQNVIRSAELWGFPNGYVQERMEQIVEFSELGEFFDRPVGLYSTGMTARLAFSLFAFLDCDVLILDEVLAVGDLFFRQKCYERFEELIARNTTILFVSHQMNAVRQYCDHVILLDKGQTVYQGNSQEAIHKYYQIKHGAGALVASMAMENIPEKDFVGNKEMFWPVDEVLTAFPNSENGQARLTRFAICNRSGEPCLDFKQGDQVSVCCEFKIYQDIGVPILMVEISNQFNILIHAKSPLQCNVPLPLSVRQGSYIRIVRTITLNIQPGEYVVGIHLRTMHPDDYACPDELTADFSFSRQRALTLCRQRRVGCFQVHRRGTRSTHLGICDLPGEYQIQVISN